MAEPEQAVKKVFVVLNPFGGHSHPKAVRGSLQAHLRSPGWAYHIYETTGEENLGDIVRQAVEDGCHICVAAGGDGTVSAVANGLVGDDCLLGIIPTGTGNILARELGIPLDVDAACALIAGDHEVFTMDVMEAGGKYYVLNLGAGVSSLAMRDTPKERKRRFGLLAYVWTFIRNMAGFQPSPFIIEVDGREWRPRASEVLVVNGTSPVKLARSGPSFSLDDGRLVVYVFRQRTFLDYLRLAVMLLLSMERRDPRVNWFEVSEQVRIEAYPPVALQADGDVIGETPIVVRLVPQAMRVIVPTTRAESGSHG